MRKLLLRSLAGIAVVAFVGCTQNAQAVSMARYANTKSWKIWPTKVSSTLSYEKENDVLTLKGSESTTIYQWVKMEPTTLYHISFFYKVDAAPKDARGTVSLRFRQSDGAQKNIKEQRYPLDLGKAAADWQYFSQVIVSPDDPNQTTQFNISHGDGIESLYLRDINVVKEAAITAQKTQDKSTFALSPENPVWKNAPAIGNFWNVESKGEPASQNTDVQLTYDDQNLYVLITNHEPNISHLKKSETERDGSIWNDDSDEIYIATSNGRAFQFITGAAGGKWDGELIQRVEGDPYSPDKAWNGDWESSVKIDKDRWWTAWKIPFATLGQAPKDGSMWRINFVRHRYAGSTRESSRWTYSNGKASEIDRYGYLRFGKNNIQAERFVEAIELHPLKIERPNATYAEVLSASPGNYHTEDWSHDFGLSRFPKSFQEKYTAESWREEQQKKLQIRGEAHSYGPFLPGAYNVSRDWAMLENAHKKYGMTFPYTMTTSGNDKNAIENGAKYVDPRPHGVASGRVAEFDAKKRESLFATFDQFTKRNPNKEDLIAYFYVVDEPTNTMRGAFSRIGRPDAKVLLDEVDAEIRKTFGGGKFGLYDFAGEETKNSPFERIAFVKWWNAQMADWEQKIRKGLNERVPGKPILMSNHNTVGSVPFIDAPLLAKYTDMVSVDPYPTSVLSLHSRARALYHTGFSTKWIHDLSGGKDTTTIAQGFVYHSMEPSPADVREWASQAMKNGAKTLSWYASGPAEITIPETWAEIKKINNEIGGLNKLEIPTATKTAIFHSSNSQFGLNDTVLHGAYTVYTLLGERIGSWFEFVGDGQNAQDLSKYNLIYVPSASYLSKESAQALIKCAKDGATIVLFDPLSLVESDLGESLETERRELIGGDLGKQRKAVRLSVKGNIIAELPEDTQLPLTAVAQGIHRGAVLAYDIEAPKDAQIFATYNDGKPAAYSRKVGSGRVIYFAAQPFGNSELAIKDSPWEGFMRALVKNAGEPTDLPIWNFYLKKTK